MNFLITGLPRSRTAWMAVAASTSPNTFCYHEPLWFLPTYQALKGLWNSGVEQNIGVSDCGLGFQLGPILEDIKPRTLIIQRDADEVIDSLQTMGIEAEDFCWHLVDAMEPYMLHPLVKVMDFRHLSLNIGEAMDWILPGVPIDSRKLKQATEMRIEADFSRVVEKFRHSANHSHWYLPEPYRRKLEVANSVQ